MLYCPMIADAESFFAEQRQQQNRPSAAAAMPLALSKERRFIDDLGRFLITGDLDSEIGLECIDETQEWTRALASTFIAPAGPAEPATWAEFARLAFPGIRDMTPEETAYFTAAIRPLGTVVATYDLTAWRRQTTR